MNPAGKEEGLKPFVASRVGEIQDNVQPVQWRHIPTVYNVADDVSRGLRVAELSDRWKNGPEFLHLPKEEWPVENAKTRSERSRKGMQKYENGRSSNDERDDGDVRDNRLRKVL